MNYKNLLIAIESVFIVSAGIFYLSTNNLLFTLIYLGIAIITGLYISLFVFKKFKAKIDRFNECSSFINKYVISLSINHSLDDSFDSCKGIISDKLYLEIKEFSKVEEKLNYLEKHYNFKVYELFKNIIYEYLDKGGDLITYTANLLSQTRRAQANVNYIDSAIKKNFIAFIIMWFFSFLIMIIARVSLNDFYKNFLNNSTYLVLVFISFLFFLISFVIFFITLGTKKFIKEGKYESN